MILAIQVLLTVVLALGMFKEIFVEALGRLAPGEVVGKTGRI